MQKDQETNKKENEEKVKKQEKTDPGTTKSTDPQENMEGPISSLMHKIEGGFDNEAADKSDEK